MTVIRRRFVDTDYGQIHIREKAGDKHLRPLICLHQSPKSSREFIKFIDAFPDARPIIAIDNPGHGESDMPSEAPEVTVMDYANAAWQVLDALKINIVDLFGNHTGGAVATEMAFQKPKRVNKIIMVSALVLTPEEQAAYLKMFEPIPIDKAGTRYTHLWNQAVKYRGPGVTLHDLAEGVAEYFRAGDAYEWGHRAAFKYNDMFAERISALPHDITVLNPADLMVEQTKRVEKYLQNGRVEDHPEWGLGFLDAFPKDAAKRVADILG